ncbi:hypothetical protein [Phenylobacterium sp.]|uniref:hypothetical protein n=1 Tax=Phenylobacterium sp. TaxID=1871053 RepID=UPI002FE030A8
MRSIAIPLLLGLAMAGPALAAPATEAQRAVAARAASPSGDFRGGVGGQGFVLSAGSEGSTAAFALERSWDDDGLNSGFTTVGVKVSAPLDEDTEEGAFLLADGLAGSTAVEVSWKRFFAAASPPNMAVQHQVVSAGRQACVKTSASDEARAACAEMDRDALIAAKHITRDDWNRATNAAFLAKTFWVAGASASVGHDRFDYRDPSDFSELDGARTPWGLSVSGGALPGGKELYAGGGYEYRRQWVDAKKLTLCRTAAGGLQDCVTAPVGRPVRKDTSALFAVVRRIDRDSRLGVPYGLELKAAYDFENEISAATASLYLVGDGDGNLRGGLRAGWQGDDDDPATDDDNFTIGVFIGAAFSVF